jgi:hypothetical protein
MTDTEFVVLEDVLLNRKATPMREEKLRRLERQALYEECFYATPQTPWQAHGVPRGTTSHSNSRRQQ